MRAVLNPSVGGGTAGGREHWTEEKTERKIADCGLVE